MVLALVLHTVLASPAFAADDTPATQDDVNDVGDFPAGQPVQYKKVTQIDMEGAHLGGTLQGPEGKSILERRAAKFNPIIKLRSDFNDQTAESVDEVR